MKPVAWMDGCGNVVENTWLAAHEDQRQDFPIALYTIDQVTLAYHCGRESKEAELSVEAGKSGCQAGRAALSGASQRCGLACLAARDIDARYASRLAFALECMVVDSHGHWSAACKLLDEYKAVWEQINPSPTTFMGEFVRQAKSGAGNE